MRYRSVLIYGRTKSPHLGLGLNPQSGIKNKGRGRKYFFSKAQSRASIDVVTGRQLSITGELRAFPP